MSFNFKNLKKKPYIIAEIGNNHNGKMFLAKKMMLAAKKAGADCVKFQTFSTNSLFSKKFLEKNIRLRNQSNKYTLKLNDFITLKKYARTIKIDFTATPFSFKEADFLINKLKVKIIKIASMDLNNYPLIEYIAKKKVPVILSTGFGTNNEIKKAVFILKKKKVKFSLLHCISEYPPIDKKLNIKRIKSLAKSYSVPIGFSDHSIGFDASLTALALGAKIIEKHFTLNKKMDGWDHAISANPLELKIICNFSKKINSILGKSKIYRTETNSNVIKFRRSIVAAKNIKLGSKIKFVDLDYKRPGDGISPSEYKKLIGKKTKRNIDIDEQILPKHLR